MRNGATVELFACAAPAPKRSGPTTDLRRSRKERNAPSPAGASFQSQTADCLPVTPSLFVRWPVEVDSISARHLNIDIRCDGLSFAVCHHWESKLVRVHLEAEIVGQDAFREESREFVVPH